LRPLNPSGKRRKKAPNELDVSLKHAGSLIGLPQRCGHTDANLYFQNC
jgi:hypothetical protein